MSWGRSAAALALLAGTCAGCGGDGLKRVAVHGTVTLSGKLLDAGTITLLPADGEGPAVNTKIEAGSYQFTRATGPTAGPHRVIVMREVNRKLPALRNPKTEKQSLADLGKFEWELTAEIPDAGSYEYHLQLE
jgi:hypothetical protein